MLRSSIIAASHLHWGAAWLRRAVCHLSCLALLACGPTPPTLPAPVDGRWSAESLESFDVTRVQAISKPTVVALWATWCAPCIEEIPELDAFQKAHPEVVVLGLATDPRSDSPAIQKILDKALPSYLQAYLEGGEGPFLTGLGLEWDGVLPKTVLTRQGKSIVLRPPVTRATLEAALVAP